VMEETLEAGIERIFGKRGAPAPPAGAAAVEAAPPAAPPAAAAETPETFASLAAEARTHYDRAMAAQREGNWALYGEEIKKLGEVLAKMAGK
jgi:uncharacterized membrane protein (UPF0182 family)